MLYVRTYLLDIVRVRVFSYFSTCARILMIHSHVFMQLLHHPVSTLHLSSPFKIWPKKILPLSTKVAKWIRRSLIFVSSPLFPLCGWFCALGKFTRFPQPRLMPSLSTSWRENQKVDLFQIRKCWWWDFWLTFYAHELKTFQMDPDDTLLSVFLIQQPVHYVVAFMLPQHNCIVFYDSLLSLSSKAGKCEWEFLVCYFFFLNWSSHVSSAPRSLQFLEWCAADPWETRGCVWVERMWWATEGRWWWCFFEKFNCQWLWFRKLVWRVFVLECSVLFLWHRYVWRDWTRDRLCSEADEENLHIASIFLCDTVKNCRKLANFERKDVSWLWLGGEVAKMVGQEIVHH